MACNPGAEKRAVQERLRIYRAKHGMGCFDAVAKACGKGINPEILRDMVSGAATFSLEKWRCVGRALDKLESHPPERSRRRNG